MKQKEMIQLGVAVVILFIAGVLIYTQLTPKKSKAQNNDKFLVEVVRPIDADFDPDGIRMINDDREVRDFYTAPDLKSGIGNPQPFNSAR